MVLGRSRAPFFYASGDNNKREDRSLKPFQLKPDSTTRSPLKSAPLQMPGQPIEEQRRKLMDDLEAYSRRSSIAAARLDA